MMPSKALHRILIGIAFFVAVLVQTITFTEYREDTSIPEETHGFPQRRKHPTVDSAKLQNQAQRRAMMDQCPTGRRLTVANHTNLTTFVDAVFDGLNQVPVGSKPIVYIGEHFKELVHTRGALAEGFWAEFGVFRGTSLISAHKQLHSVFGGIMAGFDSFQGLPSKWRNGFDQGRFSAHYERIRRKVPSAVQLYKGWFQDTIPLFNVQHPRLPATLIHHDGDLFVSTAIAFSLLADRIVPGTLLCFDELVGYPDYKQHEILALYLWMHQYQATLCPIAVEQVYSNEERTPLKDLQPDRQSACFQVLKLSNGAYI